MINTGAPKRKFKQRFAPAQNNKGMQSEIEKLRALFDKWHTIAAEQRAEIERLQKLVEDCIATKLNLRIENERLRALLKRAIIDVPDVWNEIAAELRERTVPHLSRRNERRWHG